MPIGGIPLLGKSLLKEGFDTGTVNLIMKAWRPGTKKMYTTYIKKWMTYCCERGIAPLKPTIPQACRFLRVLSEKGMSYAAINAARCALSTILPPVNGASFGNAPQVCWLLKGCYEVNPPKPKYEKMWDVNLVFELLKTWGPNKGLTLKLLSFKVTMLLLLVSSQRGQTIVNLTIDGMELEETITFRLKVLLKHNRLGEPLDILVLKPFDDCKRLCVVRAVKAYLVRTEQIRGHEQLLLSFVRPHGPISRDTVARWTLQVMQMSGVNVDKYRSHSTRGAATSAASRLGVPLNLIMKRASWRNQNSFAVYYNKRLEEDEGEVGNALLADAT